jgi:hypothetical protein
MPADEDAEPDPARDHFLAVGTLDPDRARLIAPAREEDSSDETGLHYPEDGSATGLVEAGRDYHAREPVDYQDSPDDYTDAPEAWDEPQWAHLPPMPRRRAVLPAPTGTPKIPSLIRPPAAAPPSAAPPETTPSQDFTRQLSDAEKRELAPAPAPPLAKPQPVLPGPFGAAPASPLALGVTLPAPAGPPLPPPPSEIPDLLPPLEPLRPLQPLPEEKTRFWSTGKIAAIAAVGGGLAVAAAVVVAVAVVRPKSRPTVEPPRVQRAASPARSVASAPREPQITVKSVKSEEAPASGEEAGEAAAASGEEAPAATEGAGPKPARPKSVKTAKTSKAGKASKAPRAAKRAPEADPDELLAAGTARKSTPKKGKAATKEPDADEILAAGTGPSKKARGGGDPDAILAAGSGRAKKAPEAPAAETGPTREQLKAQIQGAIRQVLPQARSCHDRHGQSGRVWVVVVLKPGAAVPEVTVEGAFAGTPTGFCVLRALEGARLPRVTGKDVTIRYPFDLQ